MYIHIVGQCVPLINIDIKLWRSVALFSLYNLGIPKNSIATHYGASMSEKSCNFEKRSREKRRFFLRVFNFFLLLVACKSTSNTTDHNKRHIVSILNMF